MSVFWGHVESIVNGPKIPPRLVVAMRDPLGTYRVECVVEEHAGIASGFERLSLEQLRPGEFVESTFREHAAWLERNGSTSSATKLIRPSNPVMRRFRPLP